MTQADNFKNLFLKHIAVSKVCITRALLKLFVLEQIEHLIHIWYIQFWNFSTFLVIHSG